VESGCALRRYLKATNIGQPTRPPVLGRWADPWHLSCRIALAETKQAFVNLAETKDPEEAQLLAR